MRSAMRPAQYLALLVYVIFLGFPLVWLLSASLKSSVELNSLSANLIPHEIHAENYVTAWNRQGLLRSALNSTGVALGATALVILVAVPAAYVMARMRGAIRIIGVGWILVSQVFPTVLVVLPLFLVLRNLQLTDSLVGLALVHATYTLPFALWMLQGYVTAIPRDLEEAAAVDGGTRWTVLVHIVFPLLMPGIAATAMFSFVSSWNEFFFALILLFDQENFTLPLTLATFKGMEGKTQLGPLAAGAVLAAIPSIVFFSFLQKKLTGGLMAGAVKG